MEGVLRSVFFCWWGTGKGRIPEEKEEEERNKKEEDDVCCICLEGKGEGAWPNRCVTCNNCYIHDDCWELLKLKTVGVSPKQKSIALKCPLCRQEIIILPPRRTLQL